MAAARRELTLRERARRRGAGTPRALRGESGTTLVEMLIALAFLAVAVSALIAVFASGVIALRHASTEGNALALADKQMEMFKTVPYAGLAIDTSTIPSPGDPYVGSPPSNLTSSQQAAITSGQVSGGTVAATQTVTGPDNRPYRVDTYVFKNTDPSGNYGDLVQVTVGVRSITDGVVGPIMGQATSAFDSASTHAPPS